MTRKPLTLFVGALLLVLAGLLLLTFQVRQSEVAVVTTFGRISRTAFPGFNVKAPWPIEKVYTFDQRVQNFEDKPSEGFTHDSFNLVTSVYVGWKITKPKEFFPKFASGSIPEAEKVLQGLLRSAKTDVTGKHPLSDFVSASAQGAKFTAIENEMLAALQAQLRTNNYGLEIEFLGLKRLGLPESVTSDVFEQMKKEREVLFSQLQAEGQREADIIRSDADRKASELLSDAEGKATAIRGEGDAQAANSLAVFNQNPELANFIFDLNALQDSLKERSILILDQHIPPFDLFGGASTNLLHK